MTIFDSTGKNMECFDDTNWISMEDLIESFHDDYGVARLLHSKLGDLGILVEKRGQMTLSEIVMKDPSVEKHLCAHYYTCYEKLGAAEGVIVSKRLGYSHYQYYLTFYEIVGKKNVVSEMLCSEEVYEEIMDIFEKLPKAFCSGPALQVPRSVAYMAMGSTLMSNFHNGHVTASIKVTRQMDFRSLIFIDKHSKMRTIS